MANCNADAIVKVIKDTFGNNAFVPKLTITPTPNTNNTKIGSIHDIEANIKIIKQIGKMIRIILITSPSAMSLASILFKTSPLI